MTPMLKKCGAFDPSFVWAKNNYYTRQKFADLTHNLKLRAKINSWVFTKSTNGHYDKLTVNNSKIPSTTP